MRFLKILATLFALYLPNIALASQESGCLPTSGTVSGLTLVQDINAAIAALISTNSGGSAPATDCSAAPIAGQVWYNTSTKFIQVFDGTNWLSLGYLDNVNHVWTPVWGGGAGSIASSSTTDLGTIPQSIISVSGTVTINLLGTSAPIGTMKALIFSGSLTLTKSANLLEPGSVNIVTQAGDVAVVSYISANVWQVLSYTPANVGPIAAAYSFAGNATGSAAQRTDVTIPGLTNKASPTGSDQIMIADAAASNSWKRATLSALANLVGVTSIGGNTGAFTLGDDLTLSTNIIKRNLAYSQGYRTGLALSAAGSTNIFGIASGAAIDSTNSTLMLLSSAYTKTTSSWAIGSGNGALDTGSIALGTWYTVFEMIRPDTGVVDVCVSVTTTACTTGTNIPVAYTLFRRIGSMLTDASSLWLKFTQRDHDITWAAQVSDVNGASMGTSSRTSVALRVPPGVVVKAKYRANITTGSTGTEVLFTSPDENDVAPTVVYFSLNNSSNFTFNGSEFETWTDNAQHIGVRAATTGSTMAIFTKGWYDPLN